MGLDPAGFSPAIRKRHAAEVSGDAKRAPSGLEKDFEHALRSIRAPAWERDLLLNADLGLDAFGKHEVDFCWRRIAKKGERRHALHLLVFLDGGAHRATMKRYAETIQAVNLCALLSPAYTCLRFTPPQVIDGAEAVMAWHDGRMGDFLGILKRKIKVRA